MAFDPILDKRLRDYADKVVAIKRKMKLTAPSLFSWQDHPLNVYSDGVGGISVDFDIDQYRITGKTYYVDGVNGSNSNDGLTKQTAFQTIYQAVEKADCKVVKIKGGLYHRTRIPRFPIDKSVTFDTWDDTPAEFSTHENLTWTKETGYTNVYKAARSSAYMAVDSLNKDEHGNRIPYKKVASIAEVDSTKGSFYTDGTTVYVHTFNSRPADVDVLVLLVIVNMVQEGGNVIFLNNIHLIGGMTPITTKKVDANVPSVYAKNSRFLYAERGDGGLTSVSLDKAYFVDCHAAYNANDGFNYHTNSTITKFIEINCKGYRNGTNDGADQDNGSTGHDGVVGIRINGDYFENIGPNVHDIYNGSQAWNLGLLSANSKANLDLRNANYYVENNAQCWFDSCVSYGSKVSMRTVNGTTTKAHVRATQLFDQKDVAAGSIVNY